MAARQVEEVRGEVQLFQSHPTYGDSFQINSQWYNYSKDGPTAQAVRPKQGDQVQVSYVLWTKVGDDGVTRHRRFIQGVQILASNDDQEPAWDEADDSLVLTPNQASTPTSTVPPTNGRAPVAQPQPQRSPEPNPGKSNLNPTLLLRIEAAKIAATYLAPKLEIDSDEALLRCAEVIEQWLTEDRPHFVTED